MRRIRRWSLLDWVLLLEAVFMLWGVRLALWVWPCDVVRRGIARLRGESTYQPPLARISRFIEAASRITPYANCLTRALATDMLLHRHRYRATVRFGVIKTTSGSLRAHAWVECGDQVVIGGEEAAGLKPLEPVTKTSST